MEGTDAPHRGVRLHLKATIGTGREIPASAWRLAPGLSQPIFFAICCLATSPIWLPGSGGARAQTATLIREALLIDGTGRPPMPNAGILIQNRRIADIRPAGEIRVPDGARVIEGSGKTVIPGIINAVGLVGRIQSPEQVYEPFSRPAIVEQLSAYASYGVTTTTSPAPANGKLTAIRSAIESGDLRSAARVVTPLSTVLPMAEGVSGAIATDRTAVLVPDAKAARRIVGSLASEGADYIQIGATGQGRLDPKIAKSVIRRARRHGLRAVVSGTRFEWADALVRAGAALVAGGVSDREIPDRTARAWRLAGVTYAATLAQGSSSFKYGDNATWLDDRYLRRSLLPGITSLLRGPVRTRQALDPDRALKAQRYRVAQRNLLKLASHGVAIALASGSGLPGSFPGYWEYREAVLMKRAGLSPMRVIQAFSQGSARALGIAATRGTLEVGHSADLIILNANPLDNIHNLRELHAVMIGGQLARL